MDFSMVEFNYFDVTISAIVLILGIKGFMQGFIKELFGLAGLVGGVYLASRFSDKAATFIDANFFHVDNISLLKLIGFLTILIIVWLGATILGAIFSTLTNASGLSFINRLLGFIAGGGKYFIIFALIITALSNVKLVKDNLEKYVSDSVLYPYLKETGSYLIELDTSNIGSQVDKKIVNLTEDNRSSNEMNMTIETNTTTY